MFFGIHFDGMASRLVYTFFITQETDLMSLEEINYKNSARTPFTKAVISRRAKLVLTDNGRTAVRASGIYNASRESRRLLLAADP